MSKELTNIVMAVVYSLGLLTGYIFAHGVSRSYVEENKVDGYHCRQITTHKTLEEAKARIKQYQAMVRG